MIDAWNGIIYKTFAFGLSSPQMVEVIIFQLAPIAEELCLQYGGYQSDNIVIFLVNLQKPFI